MNEPLEQLKYWLAEEKELGNIFPQGAVLCTVSKDGYPRSRVVSTMFDQNNIPMFFTSPASRKVEDINFSNKASLTYSFQSTVRSVSIEGTLREMKASELDFNWLKFDEEFRKYYVVSGASAGSVISSIEMMRNKTKTLSEEHYKKRPEFFIGYNFDVIERMSFYSVKDSDFAEAILYSLDAEGKWFKVNLVP